MVAHISWNPAHAEHSTDIGFNLDSHWYSEIPNMYGENEAIHFKNKNECIQSDNKDEDR